jgi:hypothetical protein
MADDNDSKRGWQRQDDQGQDQMTMMGWRQQETTTTLTSMGMGMARKTEWQREDGDNNNNNDKDNNDKDNGRMRNDTPNANDDQPSTHPHRCEQLLTGGKWMQMDDTNNDDVKSRMAEMVATRGRWQDHSNKQEEWHPTPVKDDPEPTATPASNCSQGGLWVHAVDDDDDEAYQHQDPQNTRNGHNTPLPWWREQWEQHRQQGWPGWQGGQQPPPLQGTMNDNQALKPLLMGWGFSFLYIYIQYIHYNIVSR